MQLWRSGESCERSHRLIVPLNCYKLKMKVCLCFYRNNITQLMWQGKYAPPSCFCLFFNNWLKRLLSKPHNMIIGKCNFGGAEKVKLWTITCENKRKPSRAASVTSPRVLLYLDMKTCPRSTCYRLKFHLRRIPGCWPQPGRYGHVIDEIQLVCQTVYCIDPFLNCHRLVHNGGFPKIEALYCSLNMVNSTQIS